MKEFHVDTDKIKQRWMRKMGAKKNVHKKSSVGFHSGSMSVLTNCDSQVDEGVVRGRRRAYSVESITSRGATSILTEHAVVAPLDFFGETQLLKGNSNYNRKQYTEDDSILDKSIFVGDDITYMKNDCDDDEFIPVVIGIEEIIARGKIDTGCMAEYPIITDDLVIKIPSAICCVICCAWLW